MEDRPWQVSDLSDVSRFRQLRMLASVILVIPDMSSACRLGSFEVPFEVPMSNKAAVGSRTLQDTETAPPVQVLC